jgi:protein SCO1
MTYYKHLLQLGLAWAAFTLGNSVIAAQPDHHQHHAGMAPGYTRQTASYQLPRMALVRSDGVKANFPDEIDDGKPVILNFIYTTCTAICPMLSLSFSGLQRGLGTERDQVRMISISIDPEEDTPARLAQYARQFDAQGQWRFYTGSAQSSVTLQKAFQAYFGGKMHHRPVTFMRAAPGQAWVRLEGFTTPDELLREYRALAPAR